MSRPVRLALALVVALAGLVGLVTPSAPAGASPAPAPGECASPVATAGKLLVQVVTTAPQVDVRLSPGQVTARRDRTTREATTAPLLDGLRVRTNPGQTGVVESELVLVDPSRAADLTIRLEKSGSGVAWVVVRSASGYGRPAAALAMGSSGQVTVPRSSLFDPAYALPKADDRRLVLAAYYPWFTADGWDRRPVAERPLDPRSVWDPAGVRSMTEQAKAHGVDGFVVSWMGATKHGSAFDLAARAAEDTGNLVAPYLEVPEALATGGVATVEQWLREALDRTGPASLLVDGTPVVFVWDMGKVARSEWTAIVGRLGRPVLLVGDADTATHGPLMAGWHSYLPPTDLTGAAERNTFRSGWFRGAAALDASITPKLHVGTVSPGFDDRILRGPDRPVVSRDGGRYLATWDAAVAGDPDMVLVTSWNEWYEGTEIEPGTRFGATALGETAEAAQAWKSSSPGCTG